MNSHIYHVLHNVALLVVIHALARVIRHPRAGNRMVVIKNLRDFCFVGLNFTFFVCYLLLLKQPYRGTLLEITLFVIANLIPFLIVAGTFTYRFRYATDPNAVPTTKQILAATALLILFTCLQVFAYVP